MQLKILQLSAADMLSLNGGGLINLVSAKSADEIIEPLSIIYYKVPSKVMVSW